MKRGSILPGAAVFIVEDYMGELGFHLLGRYIGYYGLMVATGVCIGAGVGAVQIRRHDLSVDDLIVVSALASLGGIIGAKVMYLAVSFQTIDLSRLTDFAYISSLMRGGFVFFGGILGMFPALWFCYKRLLIPVQSYVQSCVGCIPLGHAFGRIGCYLVGCCYGIPYTGSFAVVYTKSQFAPNGVSLFPV